MVTSEQMQCPTEAVPVMVTFATPLVLKACIVLSPGATALRETEWEIRHPLGHARRLTSNQAISLQPEKCD